MDTRVIETRKTVSIVQRVNLTSEFNVSINNVPFIPDEVIVKSIFYDPDIAENRIGIIYLDLVSDIIGCFYEVQHNITGPHFILNKPVKGTYKFQIFTGENIPDATRVGNFLIVLDFVKYKEVKEGKIY